MELHSLDLPLAVFLAILVVKEGASVMKYLAGKRNGHRPALGNGYVTRADLLQAKGELLEAMRAGQSDLHGRITEVSERLARLEGRSP